MSIIQFCPKWIFFQVMKTVYDNVGRVEKENINFDSIIKPIIDLDGDISNNIGIYVSFKNSTFWYKYHCKIKLSLPNQWP